MKIAESTPLFQLEDLGYRYQNQPALSSLSLEIRESEVVGVVGPNGAGKTTLLKILGALLHDWEGEVHYRGRRLQQWDRRTFARTVAYVPQQLQISFPYTAREIVLMGRIPHQDGSFFESRQDQERADQAISLVGCEHLGGRIFQELSGGEQQLVSLASALAQTPSVLLLDEPTAFLDLRHQLQICRILGQVHERDCPTLILVTHDLNLAQSFCRRILFLKEGRLMADLSGRGRSCPIEPELIEEVFGVRADEEPGRRNRIVLSFGD